MISDWIAYLRYLDGMLEQKDIANDVRICDDQFNKIIDAIKQKKRHFCGPQ